MVRKVYTHYYNSINRGEKNEKIVKILGVSLRYIHDGSVWPRSKTLNLLIGMEAGYPYNWTQSTNANGAVPIKGSKEFANGYDVQIARGWGKIRPAVQVVKTEWDGLLPAVQSMDGIDMIIAGMSSTAERAKRLTSPGLTMTHVSSWWSCRIHLTRKQTLGLCGC